MATTKPTIIARVRTKVCNACRQKKPVDQFYFYQRTCIECLKLRKNQTEVLQEEKKERVCVVCGNSIHESKNLNAKYCSNDCKQEHRKEKYKTDETIRIQQADRARLYREANREQLRENAKLKKREARSTEEGRKKENEITIAFRKRLKEQGLYTEYRQEQRRKYAAKIGKAFGTREERSKLAKERAAERKAIRDAKDAFNLWLSKKSDADFAKWHEDSGKPTWTNPRLSDAEKYAIRYKLDVEFRLGEINRQTWRKETLKARNDGTINFFTLMEERKSCPYCGCQITKENAVADHMDPIKHGGANSQHNLTICCRECNKRKSGRHFTEWLDMIPETKRKAALLWYRRKHGHDPEQQSLTFEFS